MRIQLSEHFTYSKLLRFVFPSIIMMIFTSVYGVVDGLFVSNYVGKTPFAALNLIYPLLMIMGSIGFMIGTGGSAIVSRTMGAGKHEKANEYFSLLIYVTIISGLVLTAAGLLFLRPVSIALGADETMIEDCVLYGSILLSTLTAFMLQNVFQSFLITAEKPHLGLAVTIAAGLTNIALDFLFIAVFQWGLAGAAVATSVSQVVGGAIPLAYFSRRNSSLLQLTKTKFYAKILLRTCTNGSSELMTNVSMSLVNMLYNYQLMQISGENGVAAYGVIMYVSFIFVAIFIGYSLGCAPIIGYHYGAANHKELKNLFRKSLLLIGISGVLMMALAVALASPLARVFVGYDASLLALTTRGLSLYSLSFLLSGLNIFGSAFFTALNNGAVSAAISFLRTLVFQVAAVLILPIFLGIDGVWLAICLAEAFAGIITVVFFVGQKNRYHYM